MIKRVPIKVNRKPIKLSKYLKAQLKMWELTEITKTEDILEMSSHFDMLVMELTKKAGYNSLSLSNPTEHKNWSHFECIYEICRMKGWDTKLYIEGQFERARMFKSMKYPLPHMMYSVNALRFHVNYLADIRDKYAKDTNKEERKKGRETKTLSTKIIDDVISSVESLSEWIEKSKSPDLGQAKALEVFNNWQYLSPFYLWSIPWFHDVLKDLDGKKVQNCREEFNRIDKSPSMRRVIGETVEKVEKSFNIPPNIQF